jgi:hypothetical protein
LFGRCHVDCSLGDVQDSTVAALNAWAAARGRHAFLHFSIVPTKTVNGRPTEWALIVQWRRVSVEEIPVPGYSVQSTSPNSQRMR